MIAIIRLPLFMSIACSNDSAQSPTQIIDSSNSGDISETGDTNEIGETTETQTDTVSDFLIEMGHYMAIPRIMHLHCPV